MAYLTNRSRLNPGPPPDLPPWAWLDSRTVQHWVGVSFQSLINWRARGTGPTWVSDKHGWIYYRTAAVAAWIEPEGPSAEQRLSTFLKANEQQIGRALWELPAPRASAALRSLARVDTLTEAELYQLGDIVNDRNLFPTTPRRPKPPFFTRKTPAGYESAHAV